MCPPVPRCGINYWRPIFPLSRRFGQRKALVKTSDMIVSRRFAKPGEPRPAKGDRNGDDENSGHDGDRARRGAGDRARPARRRRRRNTIPGATDTEIKIGNILAYSGPGLRLRRDRQDRGRLFQDDQRSGRHQRPQDQLHLLRRRLQPAEDGRAGAQARRERRGARALQSAGHADQSRHPSST